MTQFLNKSFSVHMAPGSSYRENWDAIFGKRKRVAAAIEDQLERNHELLALLAQDGPDGKKEEPPVTTPEAKEDQCGSRTALHWCHKCRDYHLYFRATAEGQAAWEAEQRSKSVP